MNAPNEHCQKTSGDLAVATRLTTSPLNKNWLVYLGGLLVLGHDNSLKHTNLTGVELAHYGEHPHDEDGMMVFEHRVVIRRGSAFYLIDTAHPSKSTMLCQRKNIHGWVPAKDGIFILEVGGVITFKAYAKGTKPEEFTKVSGDYRFIDTHPDGLILIRPQTDEDEFHVLDISSTPRVTSDTCSLAWSQINACQNGHVVEMSDGKVVYLRHDGGEHQHLFNTTRDTVRWNANGNVVVHEFYEKRRLGRFVFEAFDLPSA